MLSQSPPQVCAAFFQDQQYDRVSAFSTGLLLIRSRNNERPLSGESEAIVFRQFLSPRQRVPARFCTSNESKLRAEHGSPKCIKTKAENLGTVFDVNQTAILTFLTLREEFLHGLGTRRAAINTGGEKDNGWLAGARHPSVNGKTHATSKLGRKSSTDSSGRAASTKRRSNVSNSLPQSQQHQEWWTSPVLTCSDRSGANVSSPH